MRARPWSMIVTRVLAVGITFGVGAASFALSFTALRDLATRGHVPAGQAWLWPLMVDGAILLATLGVVVMAGDPQCRSDRRFFWLVLGGGAVVSITCNALHAILPPDQALNAWLRGFVAGVAPASLLVTTHGLTLLTRLHRRGAATAAASADLEQAMPVDPITAGVIGGGHCPAPGATWEAAATADLLAGSQAQAGPDGDAVNIPADSRWHLIAPRVLEAVSLKNAGRKDVAQVLYLSYEHALADRDIGRRLGLSHHTVGKIVRAASAQVLREEEQGALAAS